MINYENLPGGHRIVQGLRDLEDESTTAASLLVMIAQGRLRMAGVAVPVGRLTTDLELQLYRIAQRERPADAFVYYSALLQELDSFCCALECANTATRASIA